MNELQDLFIPHDEFYCSVCDRPYYLRSGITSHMRNSHNMDLDGNIIDEKKAAKRRTRKKKAPPSDAEQEGTEINGNSDAQVGDVDLGGGLVYADEAIWDLYAEGNYQEYYVKILALDIVNRSSK